MKSAVLLLDSDRAQSIPATQYAREFFEVAQVQWHARDVTRLREVCPPADYLLNFLSAPFVPEEERAKFKIAINFHPAPPEYPGVGSASRALYDKRTSHGVTAHVMDEQYDHGMVLRVRRFPIDPSWGYEALFDRALRESLCLFVEMCSDLAGGVPLRKEFGGWTGEPFSRKEFEQHPSFGAVHK